MIALQEALIPKLSRIDGERIYKKITEDIKHSRINFSKSTIGLHALNNSRECSEVEYVFNLKREKRDYQLTAIARDPFTRGEFCRTV